MSWPKEKIGWLKEKAGSIGQKIKKFFLVTDGGKEVVRKGRTMVVLAIVVVVGVGITLVFGSQGDTSFLQNSDHSISATAEAKPGSPAGAGASPTVSKMLQTQRRGAKKAGHGGLAAPA